MKAPKLLFVLTLAATMAVGGCKSTAEVLQVGKAGETNPGPCPRAVSYTHLTLPTKA